MDKRRIRLKRLKAIYDENKVIDVWAYNHNNKLFEIKNARAIKTGGK